MTVGRFCTREVDLAWSDESVQAAAQRMHAHKVGTLVVVDIHKQPIGIVTDRDVTVKVVAEDKDPMLTMLSEVMTPVPSTIRDTASIEDALAMMRATTCRKIPVTDEHGKLLGILSVDDILQILAQEFSMIGHLVGAEKSNSRTGENGMKHSA